MSDKKQAADGFGLIRAKFIGGPADGKICLVPDNEIEVMCPERVNAKTVKHWYRKEIINVSGERIYVFVSQTLSLLEMMGRLLDRYTR
jgi:hypothetical protein